MKRFFKYLLIFLGLQIVTYFIFSDYQLQKQVETNFSEMNKKRFKNKWAKKTKHNKYYFSSCGDEFFKGQYNKSFDFIRDTDSINNWNYSREDYYNNDVNNLFTNEANDSTSIINFRVCRKPIINLFTTKLIQQETFSNHNDFHAMYYNEQNVTKEIYYIWFLFKWIKIIELK